MKANLTVRVMKAFASCTPNYFLKKRREMSMTNGEVLILCIFPKRTVRTVSAPFRNMGSRLEAIFLSAAINFVLFGDSGSSDP
jgi:hypothetical protein